MGRFRISPGRLGAAALGLVGLAAAGLGPAVALNTTTTTTTSTTTTTRPRPPGVFAPTVSPTTIANRSGCGHSTTATISTGTTGDAKRVTFKVQVAGRTAVLSASGSGSRWSATLNGSAFAPEHGSGTVRATATGAGGSTESSSGSFTVADCPA
jgi:hypothetical protein